MTDMLNQIYERQWKTSAVEQEAPVSAQFAEVPEAACCLVLRRPNNLVNQMKTYQNATQTVLACTWKGASALSFRDRDCAADRINKCGR